MTNKHIPLPCPFCDGVTFTLRNDATSWAVRCANCGSRGPVFSYPDYSDLELWMLDEQLKQQATRAWNKRKD